MVANSLHLVEQDKGAPRGVPFGAYVLGSILPDGGVRRLRDTLSESTAATGASCCSIDTTATGASRFSSAWVSRKQSGLLARRGCDRLIL